MERLIPLRALEARKIWRCGFRSAALALHSGIYGFCLGGFGFGGGSESAFPYASRPRDGRPRHGARSFIPSMCLQQCHNSFCPHGSDSAFPYASRPRDGCPRHGARSFILFMCLQQCHHSICHHGSETYGEADSDPPPSLCIEYLRVLLWVDPPSTGYVL